MSTDGLNNGGAAKAAKITLYTSHQCPYAHRAHIMLAELQVPFEEVLIDLDTPRPEWYLAVNPRGLVPSIKIQEGDGEEKEAIVTESAIVAQFLADRFPSHLLPTSTEKGGALMRARINFFIDTWNTKIASYWFPTLIATTPEAKSSQIDAWVAAIAKDLEPLLADAAPFFAGRTRPTLAEVHAAPFVLRWYSLAHRAPDLLPPRVVQELDALPHFARWAKALREAEGVAKSVDWEADPEKYRRKLERLRATKSG